MYASSEGRPLVEVFGVRFLPGGEATAGTVSVFDGKRGQIIYNGSPVDTPCSQNQRSGDRLPLTGPYRAISADGCVAFVLDLCRQDDAPSSPTEILLDVYDEATRYDELITYSDGRAEVTYALLSDAAEATVKVKVLGQRAGRTVGGTVVARTDLGEVVLFDGARVGTGTEEEPAGGTVVAQTDLGEVLLFDGARVGTGTEEEPAGGTVVARTDLGELVLFDGASVGTGTEEEEPAGVVPLARSVVAVPLTSSLTVEVNLVLVDGDREEAVRESVVCVPKLGSEDVQRRPAAGVAAVEVKVTWLD